MTSEERKRLEEELFELENQLGIPHQDRHYHLKIIQEREQEAENREKKLWKAFGDFCKAIKNSMDKHN